MDEQLARIGLAFDNRKVRLYPAARPTAADGFPSIGARGCFLSHLEILRIAGRERLGRILILEDDVDFASDFLRRIGSVVKVLTERPWSIFYGGHHIREVHPEGRGVQEIPGDRHIGATHFIAVQHPAITRIRALFETFLGRPAGDARGGPMHVDGAYNWFRQLHADALTLVCLPPLGWQRNSRTDVHSLRWYDRAPIARNAVARLRRLKNAIRLRTA